MRKYTDEMKKFIAENAKDYIAADLAKMVNARFGTSFTPAAIKAYKTRMKIRSGRHGYPPGRPTKLYPAEVKSYIQENHVGCGPKEMAERLNEKFGTNYTQRQINSYYKNHKLQSGVPGRFPKGITPWNKGKKTGSYPGMVATQFKLGNVPKNYMPVGSERVNSDGYRDVKIADPNVWKAKHILLWEAVHGAVPDGSCLLFGDGDKTNVTLENLLLVSRKQLARMNQRGLIQNDIELTKTGILIADIQNAIGERKKKARGARKHGQTQTQACPCEPTRS